MKVYEMNDYEWVASNLSAEETNEWYKNEFGLSDDDLDFQFPVGISRYNGRADPLVIRRLCGTM